MNGTRREFLPIQKVRPPRSNPRTVTFSRNSSCSKQSRPPDEETDSPADETHLNLDEFSQEQAQKYSTAVNFVNHCHDNMTKMLRNKLSRSGDEENITSFKFPEIPNYLPVLDALLFSSHMEEKSSHSRPNFYLNQSLFMDQNSRKMLSTLANNEVTDDNNLGQQEFKYAKRNAIKSNNLECPRNQIENIDDLRLDCYNKSHTKNKFAEFAGNQLNNTRSKNISKSFLTNKILNNVDDFIKSLPEELRVDNDENTFVRNTPNDTTKNKQANDFHSYLVGIIQDQIRKFLKTSQDDYAENPPQQENLDIDNFKLDNIDPQINIEDYLLSNSTSCENKSPPLQLPSLPQPSFNLTGKMIPSKEITNNDEEVLVIKEYKVLEDKNCCKNSKCRCKPQKISQSILQLRSKKCSPEKIGLMFSEINEKCENSSNSTNTETGKKETYSYYCSKNNYGNSSSVASDAEFNVKSEPLRNTENSINSISDTRKIQRTNVYELDMKSRSWPPAELPEPPKMGNPFELNERDFTSLDKETLSNIGLFTDTGKIRPEVLQFLQEEKRSKSRSSPNAQFKGRTSSEPDLDEPINENSELNSDSTLSTNSSDIQSETDFFQKYNETSNF